MRAEAKSLDLRVRRTHKLLQQAFLELLANKNFQAITVQDITTRRWSTGPRFMTTWASLECADPNLRRTLFNSAATCNHQAYEVFLFLNQQGVYQVPTLSASADNFLDSYQPAGDSLQARYGMVDGPVGSYAAGSRDSVLYGAGPGALFSQYQGGAPMGNQGALAQGALRH